MWGSRCCACFSDGLWNFVISLQCKYDTFLGFSVLSLEKTVFLRLSLSGAIYTEIWLLGLKVSNLYSLLSECKEQLDG